MTNAIDQLIENFDENKSLKDVLSEEIETLFSQETSFVNEKTKVARDTIELLEKNGINSIEDINTQNILPDDKFLKAVSELKSQGKMLG